MSADFWIFLWTATWFIGLVIFTGLALAVTVYGARDLLHLLHSLRVQHGDESNGGPAAGSKGQG